MSNVFKIIGKSLKKARPRKHYIEFITAALSIPVLLTVILINLNNLNNSNKQSPQPASSPIIIKEGSNNSNVPSPAKSEVCKKEIGPISISYPKEGATITDNPVNFIIKYTDQSYCSVVWSYRINGGQWSEYSSNSPSIYNMPNGNVKFELRVQSTVSQDTDSLERNFNYQGSLVSIPTITPLFSPTSTPGI
jgi:hypothetical protein